MIIRVESNTTDSLTLVTNSLQELAASWGCQLREIPTDTSDAGDSARESEKSVDPVALAALIVSIPSAALAVTDLADRIHERRRAKTLIDKAKQISDGHTTITLTTPDGPRDLSTLNPDQLLDMPQPETHPHSVHGHDHPCAVSTLSFRGPCSRICFRRCTVAVRRPSAASDARATRPRTRIRPVDHRPVRCRRVHRASGSG